MAKVVDYRELLLDELDMGKAQARLRGTERGIDDLADSIAQQGLLQPILVAPTDDPGRWEILLGQRRYMAHQLLRDQGKLAKPVIMAAVLDEHVDDAEAKAISLTENLLREGLSTRDKIDACTYLYKHYGTVRMVAEATGLPYNEVSSYVKYPQLIDPLKKLVDDGGVKPDTAVRAQVVATDDDDNVDETAAIELAKEMAGMHGAQQRKIQERSKEDPELSATELIEDAKSGSRIHQIIVTLTAAVHTDLQRYARDQGATQDDVAGSLIEAGLADAGYLEEA